MPRAKHEGSIFKYNGRWIGAIDLGYVDGKRKKRRVRGATQKEVRDKLARLVEKRDKGVPLGDGRVTVGAFLDRWLADYVKPNLRVSSYLSYESNVRVHFKSDDIGKIPLARLTALDVNAFLNRMRAKGLAPGSVALLRMILRAAIGKALKWGLVSYNVVTLSDSVRVPRFKANALTGEQGKAFIATAAGERLEALFIVAIQLGLRQGEVLGLRWCDIDFDARTLRVENAMHYTKGALLLGPTKTESSRRSLPVTALALDALKAHRRRQQEERLRMGPLWEDRDLVFCDEGGGPLGRSSLLKPFARILEKAKLPHMRFHDLRHSCATLLHAMKVPVATASLILGHSNIRTTLALYSHVVGDMLEEARTAIDSAHGA